ncbi:ATP-dependent helicase [Rhizobium halophytocola]
MSLDSLQPEYLNHLNDAQAQAVLHGGGRPGRPLLIIAGAGSGKTNTLAHRVAHLLISGADPRRILLATFSRRAARELVGRVERVARRVMGDKAAILTEGLSWTGTFHSIGARLLRDYAEQIGLAPEFVIHDREDSADLLNLARNDLDLSRLDKRFPTKGTCLAIYSRAVNAQEELDVVLAKHFPWCLEWEVELKALFAAYVEAKQAANILDYDDLLLYWQAMVEDGGLGAEIGARFDHVLIDEYQDTNRLQSAILMGMKPTGEGVAVVGDDAQSIYSFRAAEVRNILDFPKLFDPPARVVTLARNYRSTAPVLDAANRVIGAARERHAKELFTEREGGAKPKLVTVLDDNGQADYVATSVLEAREAGARLKDQAVLFRASHHSGALEIELTRRGIPFVKFGGLKFLDAAHVKDVLAVLRLAINPRDRIAGFRALQLLPGIGPKAAAAVLDALALSEDPVGELEGFPVPPRAQQDWAGFVAMMGELKRGDAGWPVPIERVRTWYQPHLERIHEDYETRAADILQLESIAGGFRGMSEFLTELALDPPEVTSDQAGPALKDEDYLILSTIHSAKGQEWTHVFLLNCVDGCIPSDLAAGETDEIEEERRLLYVAMTRAKDGLHLMVPQRFYVHGQHRRGDRHVYANRTRFISPHMLDKFDRTSFPLADAGGPSARPGGARPVVDLKAKMAGRWK